MALRSMRVAAALTAVGVLSLAGCQSSPSDGTPGSAPSTQVASTEPAPTTEAPSTDDSVTTTSPPEVSAEERDQADIEQTLRLYTRALDDAFNGETSVEAIYPFSRDTARDKWVTEVMASQAQGVTSTGLTELVSVEVNVDGDTAEVTACVDVADVEVLDESGDSIVPDSRLERTLKDFLLERDGSAQVGWYVVEDKNRNEPCDG